MAEKKDCGCGCVPPGKTMKTKTVPNKPEMSKKQARKPSGKEK